MAIVKFVPLVPLMVQVAETHINTCKFCKLLYQYYFHFPGNDLK